MERDRGGERDEFIRTKLGRGAEGARQKINKLGRETEGERQMNSLELNSSPLDCVEYRKAK